MAYCVRCPFCGREWRRPTREEARKLLTEHLLEEHRAELAARLRKLEVKGGEATIGDPYRWIAGLLAQHSTREC